MNSRLNDWAWNWSWRNTEVWDFLPDHIPIPGLPNKQQILSRLPKIDNLFQKVYPAYREYLTSINVLTKEMHQSMYHLKLSIWYGVRDFRNFPTLPEDYNPPKYVSLSQNVTDLDSETLLYNKVSNVSLYLT